VINIAVLYGGKSAEREISKISGQEVVRNLSKKKYKVFPIEILKDGISWQYINNKYTDYYKLLKRLKIDVVFIALHGQHGEDGEIQGLLDSFGVKYTGSKVLSSSLCMDKIYSKQIFIQNGLTVPVGLHLNKGQALPKKLKYPLFVKPPNQGSSLGTAKATNIQELKRALKNAFFYSDKVLVEEYVVGTEVTCAILGNKKPITLPLVEIVPKYEYFDFKSKYNPERAQEICPARLDAKLSTRIQQAAVIAYKALNCKCMGRVDMIVKNNKIYTLEMQTIPGLTPLSLFPKAAKAAGISYPQLLDLIIKFSK